MDRESILKMTWAPVNIEALNKLIVSSEKEMDDELLKFWGLIKISPEKWKEESYGTEGGGFWVVGLIGRTVIYYNDIEEGFNTSDYKTYGTIDEYWCDQDKLIWTVRKLLGQIKIKRAPTNQE